jgi:hypothetical protein
MQELVHPPRLCVLASCESAGRAEATASLGEKPAAQSSLALLLADAGVAAVLAMQGKITFETVRLLIPRFFRELAQDGQIDRALAVARGLVRARPDSLLPVLYLRLRNGRIWYEPRFTGGRNELGQWRALCECVHKGKFIPILGTHLDESGFGDTAELARQLATKVAWPGADHERTDLAKVAQYLSIDKDRTRAYQEVQAMLVAQLRSQQDGVVVQPDADPAASAAELPKLLDTVAARRRDRQGDPYLELAKLPTAMYLTTSPETLLYKVVKQSGKNPEALLCRWRLGHSNTPQEPKPKNPKPTAEAPLIYHVFGAFGVPDSLVLTEDDFFDFLIATSTYKLMPTAVRGSLTDSALLFLGFRLTDWTFRVLFRMIMTLEGAAGMRQYAHVGVQIDPEEGQFADVERARRYLERYFASDRGAGLAEPPISLYWGSPAEFLKDLHKHLAEQSKEDAPEGSSGGENGWF